MADQPQMRSVIVQMPHVDGEQKQSDSLTGHDVQIDRNEDGSLCVKYIDWTGSTGYRLYAKGSWLSVEFKQDKIDAKRPEDGSSQNLQSPNAEGECGSEVPGLPKPTVPSPDPKAIGAADPTPGVVQALSGAHGLVQAGENEDG